MTSTWIIRAGVSALSLMMLAGSPAAALEPEAGGKAPEAAKADAPKAESKKIDQAGIDRLKAMGAFYKGLKHFSVVVKSDLDMPGAGKQKSEAMISAVRPGLIRLESKEQGKDDSFLVVNGAKRLNATGGMLKQFDSYLDREPIASIDELMGEPDAMMVMMGGGPGVSLPLALLGEDMVSQITDQAEELTIGAPEKVDGVEVQMITVKAEGGTGQIFVQTGDKPWMRRLAFHEGEGAEKTGMQIDMDWKSEKPGDEAFTFKAPEKLKAIASLRDAMGGGGDDHADHEEAPHDSIGKDAPAIKLPFITGGTGEFDLASQKDKNVVIVDFWATWCGPCVKGLPKVTKVAEAFKDKGVVFYAVNVGEEPEKVKAFMDKKSWSFTAVSDKENKVSETYGKG